MKITDIYKLPVVAEYGLIFDRACRYKITFDDSDSNFEEQAKVVEVAINNHEKLIDLLTSITDSFFPWDDCNYCKSCQGVNSHREDCDYISAVHLLDELNN